MDHLIDDGAVSRRRLITGAAAAAALGGVAAVATTSGAAGAAFPALSGPHPEVLGTSVAGLTYLPIDALDFFPDGQYNGGSDPRYVDNITGVGIAFTGAHTAGQLAASLPLPAGSVIRQVNVSYYGAPIINVYGKPLAPGTTSQNISLGLASGGGAKTQTINLDGSTAQFNPITIAAATTYTLRFYVGAGDTIQGVTIGYSAPLQGFVPFTGADPRVLDTRSTGGKLAAGEDRTVSFASKGSGGARAVLFNLAVTETEGIGGFVGAYSAAVSPWPGNASINWFGTNQNLSNAVTSALDSSGQIKLHGGSNKTHVVVDVVGYLY